MTILLQDSLTRRHPDHSPIILGLIVICGMLRPLGWIVANWRHPGGVPPVGDFSMAWLTGELARHGSWQQIYDDAQYAVQYRKVFNTTATSLPYLYPPTLVLLIAAFSYLPVKIGYCLWIVGGLLAVTCALRTAGARRATIVMTLVSPPALYNILLGQNGAYTAALFISALTLAGSKPIRAGVLAALLTVKPHLGLLIPLIWICQRRWRAFLIAVLGTGFLLAITLMVFQFNAWHFFFTIAVPQMREILVVRFPQSYMASAISVFVMARAFGASVAEANAIQLCVTIAACIIAVRIWMLRMDTETQLIVTLLLSLLATPYGYVYDMVGYAAALALLAQRPVSLFVWALFWLWPAYERDVTSDFSAPVTPLVIAALIVVVLRAARQHPHHSACNGVMIEATS
jgi:hypothetical protein